MIPSGHYERKIGVMMPVVTVSNQGQEDTTYTTEFSTWADIIPTNSRRLLEAGSMVMVGSDVVVIRDSIRNRGISKDYLLHYSGKLHVIHSIEVKDGEIKFLVKAKD